MINSTIQTDWIKQGIKIIAECSLLENNANFGDITLRNVTLYGEKYLTISEPMIFINSINNITVDQCSFKSYTKLGDPNLHQVLIDSVDSCMVTDINDKRIRYLNYTNNYQTTETKDWQDSVSLVSIQIGRGGDQVRKIVEIIENITVENAHSHRDFVKIGSFLPSLTLKNFFFKNAVLHYQPTYGVNATLNGDLYVKRVFKTQRIVFENVIVKNIHYAYQLKVMSYFLRIDVLELYENSLNSTITNLSYVDNSINFIRFKGYQLAGIRTPINYQFKFENMKIQDNQMEDGMSIFEFDSYVNTLNLRIVISKAIFRNNTFKSNGNLILATCNDQSPILIQESKFIENIRAQILLQATDKEYVKLPLQLMIVASEFIRNQPIVDAMIKLKTNSKLFVYDSYFKENYSNSRGSVIFGDFENTESFIHNSTFVNNFAQTGGVFYSWYNSSIIFEHCKFYQNFANKGGIGYIKDKATIKIKNSIIKQNYAQYSNIFLLENSFEDTSIIQDTLIQENQSKKITDFLKNFSSFQYLMAIINEIGDQEQSNSFDIRNGLLTLLNCQNDNYFFSATQAVININNSNFEQFAYQDALKNTLPLFQLALNTELYILRTNFSQIDINIIEMTYSTLQMQGGSIRSLKDMTCNYKILNSTFSKNQALIQGGVINYNKQRPDNLDSNIFINNYAPYGPNISSFAISIRLNQSLYQNVASGQDFNQSIEAELVDFDDQVMIVDQLSTLIISEIDGLVQGQRVVKVTNGKTVFNSLTFIVYIDFRMCLIGEYELNNQCIICEHGYFSLIQGSYECKECPDNAECPGGSRIIVESGFWRSSNQSSTILQCLNKKACKGGEYQQQDDSNLCKTGHGGNLCERCLDINGTRQTKSFSNDCEPCPKIHVNALLLTAISIGILIYLGLLISLNLRVSQTNSKDRSTVLKILTNFIQMLTITLSLKLDWPVTMQDFHDVIAQIGQSQDSIVSVDCFLSEALPSNAGRSHIYLKTIIVGLMPLMIFVMILVVMILFIIFQKRKFEILKKWLIAKYRFIYRGLKKNVFYWEILNISRKLFIVIVNVVLQKSINLFKAMLILLVLVSFLRIQMRYEPYRVSILNELERREIQTNIFIYFINKEKDIQKYWNQQDYKDTQDCDELMNLPLALQDDIFTSNRTTLRNKTISQSENNVLRNINGIKYQKKQSVIPERKVSGNSRRKLLKSNRKINFSSIDNQQFNINSLVKFQSRMINQIIFKKIRQSKIIFHRRKFKIKKEP
ncbi:UNKNOWN [Stylonychia lemnae]|uniref:Transmembrane protein n=1 Tax=Stylonychia lemnae TaxID=5949 RepID=A0A078A9D2_STYLE|nr:UNKNOWN [Stylonychia lemnae]|eukprot:CDW78461.1 UNKNOWN [Stylonychia lemnae]